MTIFVDVPESRFEERSYILKTLLVEFLGIDVIVRKSDVARTKFHAQNRVLELGECLFGIADQLWLKQQSMPQLPLKTFDVGMLPFPVRCVDRLFPIIYDEVVGSPSVCRVSSESISLSIDILGSCFFLLTRYEEVVESARDAHGRYAASASCAVKAGFIDRPLVNEYLELLWSCLQHLWPGLRRRSDRAFRIVASHDVDVPYEFAFSPITHAFRRFSADLIKRRSLSQAFARWHKWQKVRRGAVDHDRYNTFDAIMSLSESFQIRSTFYFIAASTHPKFDGHYSLHHPWIRGLLRQIHDRGHRIGLHGSYNTYLNGSQLEREVKVLREVCAHENIYQDQWGGRQHYLRWQAPETFQHYADAGLDYDTTLTYADRAGFRSGVCYEYPVFNLKTRKMLTLRERPLVVMECSVLDEGYMGLGKSEEMAFGAMQLLKSRCRMFDGDFTLLWHNSRLWNPREWILYKAILEA